MNPSNIGTKEKRFLDTLESLFTGADVDGDSGFVNLMRIKRAYFQSIRPKLMEEIDRRAERETSFREELFDKLARAVKPLKNRKLKISFHNLYPDIDIAESLSNILGKAIRSRTAGTVTFADGEVEKQTPQK